MIPFFEQEKNNSCGAAALRMVLKFHDIDISEEELYTKLKIKDKGTCQKEIRYVLDIFGLKHDEYCEDCLHPDCETWKKDGTIQIVENPIVRLESELKKNVCIIANILSVRDIGHFVVVVGIDSKNVIVNDPDPVNKGGGPGIKIPREEFEKRWVSGNNLWKKWFMVI